MRLTFRTVCKRFISGFLGSLLCLSGLLAVGGIPSASALGTGKMTLIRPALELSLGETDTIVPQFEEGTAPAKVTFTSADPAVVKVDADGRVEALSVGRTTVTVACSATSDTLSLPVNVIEKEHSFDDHIMITTFWPPNPESMVNDEQFKLLADAGITQVMGTGAGMDTLEMQEKMLLLCDKYGMGLTLGGYFGNWVSEWSEEEARHYTSFYRNVPAAYGFHMVDEPYTANGYAQAYLNLRKYAPGAYCHLNFLPSSAYNSIFTYQSILTDYTRLVGAGGDKVEYLMFDRYPFGTERGTMDREGFFANLRAVYEVGLREDVKTGVYIQTVGISGALRKPEDSAIRYEMYAALAFGYKQLAFFTWFTPQGQGEQFFNGIIRPNGTPASHYYAIKEINHEIHAISPILAKCDALEVYFSGKTNDSTVYGQPTIPSDFFVQVTNNDTQSKAIVSLLRHRETGRNYLMVVNNDFSNASTVALAFSPEITSLSEVSRIDGSLKPLSMNGSTVELQLAAGDGIFLALPEEFDHDKAPEGQPDATVNLAADALIYTPSSIGSNGWFICNLNDGSRFTPEGKISRAWRSTTADDTFITIDLRRTLQFDRVDLYAVGGAFNYGEAFPENITVSVSDDGTHWREVKKFSDIQLPDHRAYTMDIGTQTARYIRLDITDIKNRFGYVALDEIEVYNDGGQLPPAEKIPFFSIGDKVISYTEGENIALGKQPFASSATDEEFKNLYGWSLDYLNDGDPSTGWTTAVHRNDRPDSTEYVGVFFGDMFAVEKLVIHPKGCYPEDFVVELSTDLKTWTKVYEITGSEAENGMQPLTITLDTPVPAMYVRIFATKLRADNGGNGYLFQLGELEAYGRPVCDKTLLEAAMTLFASEGGDTQSTAYTNAQAAMGNACLTSTQMKQLTETLYTMVGRNPDGSEIPPETEPESIPETAPDTSPISEPETCPVIDPGTDPGTDAATDPSAETSAETEPAGGCGSVLGAGAALALPAAASLAVKKKRRED